MMKRCWKFIGDMINRERIFLLVQGLFRMITILLISSKIICLKKKKKSYNCNDLIFNTAGVAGAVLQTPLLLIESVSQSSGSSKPSKHHYTQTVRASEPKF